MIRNAALPGLILLLSCTAQESKPLVFDGKPAIGQEHSQANDQTVALTYNNKIFCSGFLVKI